MTDIELYKIIIPSLTALGGVILGTLVTSLVNWKLKSKETKLRLFEKLFDKRIAAYEGVLDVSKLLRTTVSTKAVDASNYVITYPSSLHDRETFDDLLGKLYFNTNFSSHWINIELLREVNFLLDYLMSLEINMKSIDDENFPKVGKLVKQDFVNIAGSLEQLSVKHMQKDFDEMDIKITGGDRKYPIETTRKRLESTSMFVNIEQVRELEQH